MESCLETKILEFSRKGDMEKVHWLEKIDILIPPSQVKRIQQNDKTVLKELILPSWIKWDFLYMWADSKKPREGRICILCNEHRENGIDFREKYVCEDCFLKLKNLE